MALNTGNQYYLNQSPSSLRVAIGQDIATLGAAALPGQTAAEAAAGVTPVNLQYAPYNGYRYGAAADNSTNNSTAFGLIQTLLNAGLPVYLPYGANGIYLTSTPLHCTGSTNLTADPGVRIKLTAAASYVLQIDGTSANIYNSNIGPLILDANGNAPYCLDLTHLIGGIFPHIRCTNATVSGMRWHWAQQCIFPSYQCSGNIETFTTTPVNGIVIDGGSSSSDNLLINPAIEKVSGAGVLGTWMINTGILFGTVEANVIGVVIGHATSGSGVGNWIMGTDMEVNSTTDVQILATAYGNTIEANAGYLSGAMQVTGAKANRFRGVCGGITFDATSNSNDVDAATIIGTGRTITDSGSSNSWRSVYNITDGISITDKPRRGRTNYVFSTTGSVNIDCSLTRFATVTFNGAGVSTVTINPPTNTQDGIDLAIAFHVTGAGALTIILSGAANGFKAAAVTVPGNGFSTLFTCDWDPNQGFWITSQSSAVIPN
jgi:hypothetical protein